MIKECFDETQEIQMISSVFWSLIYFYALWQCLWNKRLVMESKAVSEAWPELLHYVEAEVNVRRETVTSKPRSPRAASLGGQFLE